MMTPDQPLAQITLRHLIYFDGPEPDATDSDQL